MTKELMEMIFQTAIDNYGPMLQTVVAIEEMAELQKELTKILRDEGKRTRLVEELADVEIMLYQLKRIFEITDDELFKVKSKKAIRTLEAMFEERKENEDIQDLVSQQTPIPGDENGTPVCE